MANRPKASNKKEPEPLRFFKYITWAAGAFAVFFILLSVGAWIYISVNYPPAKLKTIATEKLSGFLNRKVTIGDIRFNVFGGFEVADLHIGNRIGWANQDFVEAKDISISYHLLPLLWGKISLGEIKLNGPQILVERRGSQFNISDMLGSASRAAMTEEKPDMFSLVASADAAVPPVSGVSAVASKSSLPLSVDAVNISHGKLVYLDETGAAAQRSDLTDLNLKVSNLSLLGDKTTFTLSTPFDFNKTAYQLALSGTCRYFLASQSLKGLSVSGTLNDQDFSFSGDASNLTADFSPNMDVNASLNMLKFAGLIPSNLFSMPQGLTLSGPAQVKFHLSGSLSKGLELKGTADASNLVFQYQDLCVKGAKSACQLDFDYFEKKDSYELPSFHAVFMNWVLDGSFFYKTGVSVSAHVQSKGMPLNGLPAVVPRLKNSKVDGSMDVNLTWNESLKKPTIFVPDSGQIVLKGVGFSLPNDPYIQNLNTEIDFAPGAVRVQNAAFNCFDGSGTASLVLTIGKVLAYSFGFDLKNINAGKAINGSVDAYVVKDPQNYKDKMDGVMNLTFKGTGHGTAGAEMLAALNGSGNYSVTGATVKGYPAITYMNGFFKDKGSSIVVDNIAGTLDTKNTILTFTTKADGKMGEIRANGALNMATWLCSPEIKIQSDIHQSFLDLDALKTQLPDNIKDKFDPKLLVDSNGNVDLDFHITGDPSKPDLKWLDVSRLGNVFLNNYVNQLGSKGQNILQGLFGH